MADEFNAVLAAARADADKLVSELQAAPHLTRVEIKQQLRRAIQHIEALISAGDAAVAKAALAAFSAKRAELRLRLNAARGH